MSFGYPLRFFAGLWTAYPEILNLEILTKFFSQFIFVLQQLWLNGINGINGIISLPSIVFLLFAYAFWGESSVILAWTHEAILQKNPQKIHCQYLYRQVENNDQKRPLSCTANGKIIKIWNWTHIVSMVFLSFCRLHKYK